MDRDNKLFDVGDSLFHDLGSLSEKGFLFSERGF